MSDRQLPPGQFYLDEFPRFGLDAYAKRYKTDFGPLEFSLELPGQQPQLITQASFLELPQSEQISDFHCVTTWSIADLNWRGIGFTDFYKRLVEPYLEQRCDWVMFECHDGFRARMMLEDLLKPDVLLAFKLNGEQLPAMHGAPLRLIAPAHYGYKNPKHVKAIRFVESQPDFKFAAPSFMEHARGRVAEEERGKTFPGWVLRYLYRPLIKPTIRLFKKTQAEIEDKS